MFISIMQRGGGSPRTSDDEPDSHADPTMPVATAMRGGPDNCILSDKI